MRALCWHGKGDVRVDTVPDPKIEHPRDAVIKITACAISGSDLHLLDGYQPTMESGSRSRKYGRSDRTWLGGDQSQNWRPRCCSVHNKLRRVLVLQERPVFLLRPHQSKCRISNQSDGTITRRSVWLQPHARRLLRRIGGIFAGAHGRRRANQNSGQRH